METRFKIINSWLSRNILRTTNAKFIDKVRNEILTLRETANRHSKFGEQCYQKCFYKTNRCVCW